MQAEELAEHVLSRRRYAQGTKLVTEHDCNKIKGVQQRKNPVLCEILFFATKESKENTILHVVCCAEGFDAKLLCLVIPSVAKIS